MERFMQGSDQCYGRIEARPPEMFRGQAQAWHFFAYTEASSVSQEVGGN
jgi:hypothetical protein